MKLPPPFFERPFWLQGGRHRGAVVFGILSGSRRMERVLYS